MSIKVTYRSTEDLSAIMGQITDQIRHEMERRAFRSSLELYNESQEVLRGQRNGRIYRVPGTKAYYTASAPGEPPAVRTGLFRMSWKPTSKVDGDLYTSTIENMVQVGTNRKYLLGELLEGGTIRMAPRPYQDEILDRAEQNIVRIYSEPYF